VHAVVLHVAGQVGLADGLVVVVKVLGLVKPGVDFMKPFRPKFTGKKPNLTNLSFRF
jgi:hypothetical protein